MDFARNETWPEYRRRLIRETELFIEWGLAHPDEVMGIPVKRAGGGGFPRAVGQWFWDVALTNRVTERIRRWRGFFRGRRWRR